MPSFWSDQVRDSCSVAAKFRRGSCCSKAQMHLHKILFIIKSIPTQETQFDGLGEVGGQESWLCGAGGFGVDLNLRLGSFTEAEGSESSAAENGGLSACSGVGKEAETASTVASDGGVLTVERSCEGECEPQAGGGEYGRGSVPIEHEANQNGEGSEVVEEKRTELESEITNLESPSSEIDDNEEEEEEVVVHEEESPEAAEEIMIPETKTKSFTSKPENRDNGSLDLLVEAAKLISGNFGENDESEAKPEAEHRLRTRKRSDQTVVTKTVINEESKGPKRKKMNWMAEYYGEFEDASPVVKSKRGRSQVLPSRYRDSFLEPLKRPQRSTMVAHSAKRRSRR